MVAQVAPSPRVMLCCKTRGSGEVRRLADFARKRKKVLLQELRAIVREAQVEAVAVEKAFGEGSGGSSASPDKKTNAADDVSNGPATTDGEVSNGSATAAAAVFKTVSGILHPQCRLDFDRADFSIGDRRFPVASGAASGEKDASQAEFALCLLQVCGSRSSAYVVSALASQASMAAIALACYSGPQTYSVPSGCTEPRYTVQRRDNDVVVGISRVSEGFDSFCTPGGDPYDCSSNSFIRQKVTAVLRGASVGAKPQKMRLDVEEVLETVRITSRKKEILVMDGLSLEFVSSGAGSPSVGGLSTGFLKAVVVLLLALLLSHWSAVTSSPSLEPLVSLGRYWGVLNSKVA